MAGSSESAGAAWESGAISSAQALKRYSEYLTPFEQSEILDFPQWCQKNQRQPAHDSGEGLLCFCVVSASASGKDLSNLPGCCDLGAVHLAAACAHQQQS
eukprot:scaffold56352_cov20-Tisochrysis_lutea.AAC.2